MKKYIVQCDNALQTDITMKNCKFLLGTLSACLAGNRRDEIIKKL